MKKKRARLEAWKRGREAGKALHEARAKAEALAGKTAPRMYHSLLLMLEIILSLVHLI